MTNAFELFNSHDTNLPELIVYVDWAAAALLTFVINAVKRVALTRQGIKRKNSPTFQCPSKFSICLILSLYKNNQLSVLLSKLRNHLPLCWPTGLKSQVIVASLLFSTLQQNLVFNLDILAYVLSDDPSAQTNRQIAVFFCLFKVLSLNLQCWHNNRYYLYNGKNSCLFERRVPTKSY